MNKFSTREKLEDSWKDGNIHYVINNYLRTVTAIVYPTYDLIMDVDRCARQANLTNYMNGMKKEMLPKMTATAYCSPDDEFDEEKGMRVAKAKLLRHLYKEKHRILEDYQERILDFELRLEEKVCQYRTIFQKYENLLEDVEELLN